MKPKNRLLRHNFFRRERTRQPLKQQDSVNNSNESVPIKDYLKKRKSRDMQPWTYDESSSEIVGNCRKKATERIRNVGDFINLGGRSFSKLGTSRNCCRTPHEAIKKFVFIACHNFFPFKSSRLARKPRHAKYLIRRAGQSLFFSTIFDTL